MIFADHDIIKEAFGKKELSNRLYSEKIQVDTDRFLKDWGISEMAISILGKDDSLVKNGAGISEGIGDGYYDATHRRLRLHWHDTIKRLVGRNKISEIIQHSSAQVNAILKAEGSVPQGIDPREVFVNGEVYIELDCNLSDNF